MYRSRKNGGSYLTPKELVEKYPELMIKFQWDARLLGIFLKAKLLDGYVSSKERKSYISEQSLKDLIEYVNKKIEGQKIDTSNFNSLF